MVISISDMQAMTVEISLLILGIFLLFLEITGVKNKKTIGYVGIVGLLTTMALSLLKLVPLVKSGALNIMKGFYILDPFSLFFKELFLIITFMVILMSLDYFEKKEHPGEYYAILVFICMGMSLLVSAGELVSLFVSLELISIPLYILASYLKFNKQSSEAGIKYFLLGAVSTAFLLYGLSLLYGTFGTTNLNEMFQMYRTGQFAITAANFPHVLLLAIIFITVGFGFKVAAAPFHMWAPDVYQGAPTPVTAFLSVGPKAAGMAIMMRVFAGSLIFMKPDWTVILAALAALSMTVGNLVAIPQTNIKRMLAYSGIAQMGYVLVGLAAATYQGAASAIFYLFIYAFTNLGAFAIIIIYSHVTGSDEIKDFAGLAKRSPILALIMMLALLCLAGVPPLAGFVGKFYLFYAAYQSKLYWLVLVGVINSVISLFYYLNVLKYIYFEKPAEEVKTLPVSNPFKLTLALSTIGIVVMGLFPPLAKITLEVAQLFFPEI